ncbi:oligosaccharide biosynthesis protein Alg14 like protein [Lojkania enalia]|uniref:UDP-N-acetylglucosamine transferase subunit ALG14 n=1 Tax=Lojkania enalia TaxID=147567 RepID=A0A9P4KHQ4_9PLEO|nr:oligosaccharide biosynthesis protein Alg14 like protein [Didymosphaeria enalia]
MAPLLPSLYTLSFAIAFSVTLFIGASLRLLSILPHGPFRPQHLRRKPCPTRVLIVLGSGGHTHEMFYLLRGLDTRKYTHRTYLVSSGDAFSAQRAAEFEANLLKLENERHKKEWEGSINGARSRSRSRSRSQSIASEEGRGEREGKKVCVGPEYYDIAVVPRARRIHQSLLTTPFSSLYTLLCAFKPLFSAGTVLRDEPPHNAYEAASRDFPDLIITNGPATAVIVILASLVLRFFNVRGANSRGKVKTVYVESFARVKTLSISGKLLLRIVDRFLVQWEELEGKGGRAEFWGILV